MLSVTLSFIRKCLNVKLAKLLLVSFTMTGVDSTHRHTHTHKHTLTDIQGLRGCALGGYVFSPEENPTTTISIQIAADILNCAFQLCTRSTNLNLLPSWPLPVN